MNDNAVLIVEDHKDISDMLAAFLEEHGYVVECACDGKAAAERLSDREYLIVLMDLMLPYISGAELIKQLRTHSDTPVICLSAKSGIETRLEVLKMGADDYILKPFDLDEVLVRMEVVLRRSQGSNVNKEEKKIYSCGGLLYYPLEHRVEYQGMEISLTSKEQQLLQLFLENPTKTYSKANLYESVWQSEYLCEDNTINVHVSNLRGKLKKATGNDYIETVWGIGYRLKGEKL